MGQDFEFVDIDYLEDISGGDNAFKKELIGIFLKQIPEFLSKMQRYLDEKENELLAKEAHTAKSSVLIFKMEDTGLVLKQIQLLAENNKTGTIGSLLKKVEASLQGASKELSSYVKTL